MNEKNPAKGLEDISRMFLTAEEDESIPEESSPVFLSAPVRKDYCTECANVLESPQGPMKCKIFSYKNEVDGGLVLKTIMPGYAKYCRYFEHVNSDKMDADNSVKAADRDTIRINMEVDELINSQKNIVIKDDVNFQKNIEALLAQHLENGFKIVRIELEKTERQNTPACKTKRNEKVTIIKKGQLLSSVK